MADIESIANTTNSSLIRSFAGWIKNQQDVVPMTSHRQIFRQHMNDRMGIATEKGTWYRLHAFSSLDQTKFMKITTVGSKKILSVDGFVRTVVQGPVSWFYTQSVAWADGR